MTGNRTRNLLRNASFEQGSDLPAAWQWVIESGQPTWKFDVVIRHGKGRSICLLQDAGRQHGEFRQVVKCRGGQRYRLRGRIRIAVEGTGVQSGANLYLRSCAGGKVLHDMWVRPFLVGREDWQLLTVEYETAPAARELMVSFDMRCSAGAAWFDELELCEVEEPLARHAPLEQMAVATAGNLPLARAVVVIGDAEPAYLVKDVLSPLLGRENVRTSGRLRDCAARRNEAVIVWSGNGIGFKQLEELSNGRVVIVSPAVLAGTLARHGVRCETTRSTGLAPCARVENESPLTRGFRANDVFPWWTGEPRQSCFFEQRRLQGEAALLKQGFRVVARSVDGTRRSGPPVILWRPGRGGGGIAVLDLEALNKKPGWAAEPNLACLLLTNALGRPQTCFGSYVVPGHDRFDYRDFCGELRRIAASHKLLRLSELGRSVDGHPIYSLSLGRDDVPTVLVDCAIHSDEWAPAYGSVLYLLKLARELEAGRPWARAMLARRRLECIPVLSPDGWDIHRRFLREYVDLNRNFPVYWKEFNGGAKGRASLSEPETRLMDRLFRTRTVAASINWHETTANTNWVGVPHTRGRYRKYVASVPALFAQLIDNRHFCWQASTWTQISDLRNFLYHPMDSRPYVRDYLPQHVPYLLHHADSLGADGLTIEQYGNSDIGFSCSPQRTDMTGSILELLVGLQMGLVARNCAQETRAIRIPLAGRARERIAITYDAEGREVARRCVARAGGEGTVQGELAPGQVVVVADRL